MSYLANQANDPNNLGYFATPEALEAAYPVGFPGAFALVGSTNTYWAWDEDTNQWVDTGNPPPQGTTGPTVAPVTPSAPVAPVAPVQTAAPSAPVPPVDPVDPVPPEEPDKPASPVLPSDPVPPVVPIN